MTRVLVTGAGGHLGRALVAGLVACGHEVISLCRRSPAAVPPGPSHRIVRGDLADALADLPAADAIVHAAAATHLDPSLRAADYARSNVCGTVNLLDYAARVGCRSLIMLSTLSVYGRIGAEVLDEDVAPEQPNLYGRSKRLAEEVLLDCDGAADIVCLRLPGVTGPGDHRAWLGRCLLTLYRDEPLHFANGDASFNNIVDISELTRLVEHLLARPADGRRSLVNVAAEAPVPLVELLTAMRDATGSRAPLIDDGPRTPCFRIDTARLRDEIGFVAAPTMDQALRFVRADQAAGRAPAAAAMAGAP